VKRRTLLKLLVVSLAATACAPVPKMTPAPEPGARSERAVPTVTAVTPVADVKYGDWFKLKGESARYWDVVPAPGDANQLELRPREPLNGGGPAKQVLVMYTRASSSYDTAINRILAVLLEKRVPAVVTVKNITRDPTVAKQGLAFAQARRFDLIVSMGSDTTDFLVKAFPDSPIPVVTVCSKDPVLLGYVKDYESGSRTNFAYTSLDAPVDVQLSYLLQVVPGLKNIAVLYSESNTSAKETQVKPLKAGVQGRAIDVLDVVVQDDKKAREELAVKVAAAAAEMRRRDPAGKSSIFWITGSTPVFAEIETINAAAGGLPVLSVVPDVVQEGRNSAVLSIGVNFDSNAYVAAIYATDILTGKATPGKLKVGVVSPPDISINFARTREAGLRIPFGLFESASYVYDNDGKLVRANGRALR
jgi:putative ABC transport system substrate-binding protein